MPGAWDELFTTLFGRTPPDLAHGCLQDIHWSAGLMGYLPQLRHGLDAGRAAVRARHGRRSGHPAGARPRRLQAPISPG
ncbi:MAG: hypothetical protein WDM85_03430 [Caulobacteraceae bacterium]